MKVYAKNASFSNVGDDNSISYIISFKDRRGGKYPLYWKSQRGKRGKIYKYIGSSSSRMGIYLRIFWKEIIGERNIRIKVMT